MIRNRAKLESYPDGEVRIYAVTDGGEAGGPAAEVLMLKETLRFRERTVGTQRYYNALQAGVTVQLVLRCPLRLIVSAQDVAAMPSGQQYRIRLVQHIEGSNPPSMDLTLEEVRQAYATV